MPHKCCIFVDGENLRHSIAELFEDVFNKNEYLPRKADWTRLFDWLADETQMGVKRLRAYWYVIEHLDFTPYLPLPLSDTEKLRLIFSRSNKHKRELDVLQGNEQLKRINEMANECQRQAEKMKRRFDGWRRIQDGIAHSHHAVEFRRAGAITYNLLTGQLGREKAVDVRLAMDLYMLRDIYEVAIIVSGDQDYVPAVQVVKDSGKTVINVAFETRSGRLLPGGARRLNQITDSAIKVKYHDLKGFLHL